MQILVNAMLLSMFVLFPGAPVIGQATEASLELALVTEVDGHRVEFGRIGAVVADGQGRMYVADVHEIGQMIAILDSSGVRIGTLGGRGEGPGEFKNLASSLGWMGDNLVAMDHSYNQTKVKFFDPSGRVVQTSTLPSESGLSLRNPRVFSSGPRMFLVRFEFTPVVIRTREQPVDPILPAARYEEITRNGSAIPLPALSEPGSGVGAGARRGAVQCRSVDQMWLSGFSPPFSDRGPLRAFTPSGELAKGNVDSLLVEILDPESGVLIRSFSRETRPIPLTDKGWESVPEISEIRQHEKEIFEQKVEAMGPPGRPCPVLEMRPEFYPVIRTLLVDEHGRFWVELTTEDGFALGGFDESGRFLGEAPMPDRDPRVSPYIRSNRLYLVTVDDMDVQGLQVYEIRLPDTEGSGSTY